MSTKLSTRRFSETTIIIFISMFFIFGVGNTVFALGPKLPSLDITLTPFQESSSYSSATPLSSATTLPTNEPVASSTLTPSIDSQEIGETPIVTPKSESGFFWTFEVKISPDQEKSLELPQYNILQKLQAEEVTYSVKDGKLLLSGTKNIDQIRLTLYEDLKPVVDFLGGKVILAIQQPSDVPGFSDIRLEARSGTGFMWALSGNDPLTFKKYKEDSFDQRYSGPSSSSIQTLYLESKVAGDGLIILEYKRSWENSDEYARLDISFPETVSLIDLSDPEPLILEKVESEPNPEVLEALDNLPIRQSLPASFDWRSDPRNIVPAVRNQGTCGACWAFGTVGIMESALKLSGGTTADLSEQFLISCNKEGWSCDGGLTAHDYHYNTLGYNQSAVGAVLESAMPYTQSNGSCSAKSHPYLLKNWTFITGSEWTIPTVDQIKTAIATYGPVTTGICVGPNFNAYTSGVMSTGDNADIYCGGYTNHQIIIVGWNDATTSWIVRNSWGASWGESGYIRIKYGLSRVGEGPSWVEVNTDSLVLPAPTLAAPANAGLLNSTDPSLSWNSVTGAATYQVQIDNTSTFTAPIDVDASGITETSYSANSLSQGLKYWRVRAVNSANKAGTWSAVRTFTIDTVAPAAPVLKTPLNDAPGIRASATFSWSASAGANGYRFQYDNNEDFSSPEYTSSYIAILTHQPTTPMTVGTWYWRVGAKDAASNESAWSLSRRISILPAIPIAPVIASPANGFQTNNTKPTLSWNSVSGESITYQVQIDNISTFTAPIDVDVSGITDTSYTTNTLSQGLKYWRLRAKNVANETGAWSAVRSFTVDTVAPAAPVLKTPLNDAPGIRASATFSWSASVGANGYRFQYDNNEDFSSPEYTSSYVAILTHQPTTPMTAGTWYWRVGAKDAASNESVWSVSRRISILPAIPVAPVLDSPANGFLTNNITPDLSWNSVSGESITYQVQIDNVSTFTAPIDVDVSGISETSITTDTLSQGLKYWRVRAKNVANEPGVWSAVRSFTVDTVAPAAPVLKTPLNDAPGIRSSVTFTWSASVGANGYRFQYDNDEDFSSPEYTSDYVAILTHQPTTPMTVGTWYWRVGAKDAASNESDWSLSRRVSILPAIPTAPTIVSPANGFQTNNTNPTLSWNSVAGESITYQIQIDNVSTFAAPLNVDVSGISETTYSPDPISYGTIYWRVRALNMANEPGPWSTVRSIIIVRPPAVLNGNFESGHSIWDEYSSQGYYLITTSLPVVAHGGSYAAWLGGIYDEYSDLTQYDVNMSGVRYLHFWYQIRSSDFCGYDVAGVFINGDVVKAYSLCSTNATSGWVHQVIDLGAYSGTYIDLEFFVYSDFSYLSSFIVDDVSITSSSSTPPSTLGSSPITLANGFPTQKGSSLVSGLPKTNPGTFEEKYQKLLNYLQ